MYQSKTAEHTIYLQITAGQGPKECAWVAAKVTQKILAAASQKKVDATLVEMRALDKCQRGQNTRFLDTCRSALIGLTGESAQLFAAQWQGSVLWQGESPFRQAHKRMNWFVGVQCVEYSCLTGASLAQLEKDVHFEVTRAGGPGGQHVNKTSTAVWATHLPTGIKLRAESERSQHRNRRIALQRLQLQLNASAQAEVQRQVAANWQQHYQLQRGNPVKVFSGADFIEKY